MDTNTVHINLYPFFDKQGVKRFSTDLEFPKIEEPVGLLRSTPAVPIIEVLTKSDLDKLAQQKEVELSGASKVNAGEYSHQDIDIKALARYYTCLNSHEVVYRRRFQNQIERMRWYRQKDHQYVDNSIKRINAIVSFLTLRQRRFLLTGDPNLRKKCTIAVVAESTGWEETGVRRTIRKLVLHLGSKKIPAQNLLTRNYGEHLKHIIKKLYLRTGRGAPFLSAKLSHRGVNVSTRLVGNILQEVKYEIAAETLQRR